MLVDALRNGLDGGAEVGWRVLRPLDQPSFCVITLGDSTRTGDGEVEVLEGRAGVEVVESFAEANFSRFNPFQNVGAGPTSGAVTGGAPAELDAGDNQLQTGLGANGEGARNGSVVDDGAGFEFLGGTAVHRKKHNKEGKNREV